MATLIVLKTYANILLFIPEKHELMPLKIIAGSRMNERETRLVRFHKSKYEGRSECYELLFAVSITSAAINILF